MSPLLQFGGMLGGGNVGSPGQGMGLATTGMGQQFPTYAMNMPRPQPLGNGGFSPGNQMGMEYMRNMMGNMGSSGPVNPWGVMGGPSVASYQTPGLLHMLRPNTGYHLAYSDDPQQAHAQSSSMTRMGG